MQLQITALYLERFLLHRLAKVKILNHTHDRNEPTFRPLTFVRDMLYSDYSIELTTDDDFDYMFIGMSDVYDMSL